MDLLQLEWQVSHRHWNQLFYSFFQMQKVKVLRREDFKEVQIIFHANDKIPNHKVARKKNERPQGKPK
jgi:hypothetical protein